MIAIVCRVGFSEERSFREILERLVELQVPILFTLLNPERLVFAVPGRYINMITYLKDTKIEQQVIFESAREVTSDFYWKQVKDAGFSVENLFFAIEN